MSVAVDHPELELNAELRLPGQDMERVRVIARYPRLHKSLVAYPKAPGFDLGEIGATIRVDDSMLTAIRTA